MPSELKNIIKIFKVMLVGWIGLSCSAPHDNPLDPASPNFQTPPDSTVERPAPTFSSRVRSVHTGRVTTDTYRVSVELWPDSVINIDTVFCRYREQPPTGMRFSTATGRWTASLTSSFLGDDDLESVVGQPFYFIVEQSGDTTWEVGPRYLFRVIQETPLTADPDSNLVVQPFPVLTWPSFSGSYPYFYQVIVEHKLDFGIVESFWTSDTLLSSVTQIQVPDSLPDDNDWYWILAVYDEFCNTSYSLETHFQVVWEDSL